MQADTPAASAPTAAAPSLPQRIREVSLRPTDAGYPPELSAKGVQGTIELRVRLGADGSPTEVSLHASSRSPERDQAAVAVARGLLHHDLHPAGQGR
ncbi:TonB family protein [Ideonella sp.]|uniref:TonB family protein n=1 Tax=Ideonella sp. TaxID=1929293 RepID=UPI0035AE2DA2